MAPVCHPSTPRCGNCGAGLAHHDIGVGDAWILCGRALQRIKFFGDNRGEWMGVNSWCPLWPLASVKGSRAGQPGETPHGREES